MPSLWTRDREGAPNYALVDCLCGLRDHSLWTANYSHNELFINHIYLKVGGVILAVAEMSS